MKINHIRAMSKILIDLSAIRQKIIMKNTFADIIYNVLLVRV